MQASLGKAEQPFLHSVSRHRLDDRKHYLPDQCMHYHPLQEAVAILALPWWYVKVECSASIDCES